MVRDSFQAQKSCFKRLLCLNSLFASQTIGSAVCRLYSHVFFKPFFSQLDKLRSVQAASYFGGGEARRHVNPAYLFPLLALQQTIIGAETALSPLPAPQLQREGAG